MTQISSFVEEDRPWVAEKDKERKKMFVLVTVEDWLPWLNERRGENDKSITRNALFNRYNDVIKTILRGHSQFKTINDFAANEACSPSIWLTSKMIDLNFVNAGEIPLQILDALTRRLPSELESEGDTPRKPADLFNEMASVTNYSETKC